MSRPLRIEVPDAWYHVMNRGLRRQPVFSDVEDYQIFLETLRESCERFGVSLGAYCLMPNHYHLLVHTPNANLSRFMRHVNGVYTQRFNRKNSKDGPLFRGRYRALVVDADEYLLQLVRYIHLNPVKAKLVNSPREYAWSSHRYFLKPKGSPAWLTAKQLLKWFSSRPDTSAKLYRDFMREASSKELENFYSKKQWGWILGTPEFKEKMQRLVSSRKNDEKEITHVRNAKGEVVLRTIIREVSKQYKVKPRDLMTTQRGKANLPRNVALYLACELTGLGQSQIAIHFGASSYRSVATQHFRVKEQMQSDKRLKKLIAKIKSTCS